MAYRNRVNRMTPRIRGINKRSRAQMNRSAMVPYKGKKYSSRAMQRFHQQPNAVRYGFFMNMLKRYAAVKAIGAARTTAEKMITRIKTRKIKRVNDRKMAMQGFRVTRFCLISFRITGTSPDAGYNNGNYDYGGFTFPLITQVRNFPNFSTPFPVLFDMHSVQWVPLSYVNISTFVIHPTWPGSKMTTFKNQPQGTNNGKEAQWGVIPGNQNFQNGNYNWNTRAVDDVKPIVTTGNLPNDNLDILYRKIQVYKSTLTLEFFNNSTARELDIHIIHFKCIDFDYRTVNASCYTSTSWFDLMKQLYSSNQNSASFLDNNNQQFAFEYCLQHKKLPSKNFYTKSWKTITLGRMKATDDIQVNAGGSVVVPMPAAVSNKPYRKITFKYGSKTWIRSGCVPEGSFLDNQILTDRQKRDTEVMIFMTPNKNYMTDNLTHTSPTTDTYTPTTSQCNFRWWKTNVWRECN